MPIDIHGKKYITVAERVQEAHQSVKDSLSITTELIDANDKYVLFKAIVEVGYNKYTGYATSTFAKGGMESKSPFEVAETSAVGRALGFAGFGSVDGIASADEVSEAVESNNTEDNFKVEQSPDYKRLFALVVSATTMQHINDVYTDPAYKTLVFGEKNLLNQRISKQVPKVKHE